MIVRLNRCIAVMLYTTWRFLWAASLLNTWNISKMNIGQQNEIFEYLRCFFNAYAPTDQAYLLCMLEAYAAEAVAAEMKTYHAGPPY